MESSASPHHINTLSDFVQSMRYRFICRMAARHGPLLMVGVLLISLHYGILGTLSNQQPTPISLPDESKHDAVDVHSAEFWSQARAQENEDVLAFELYFWNYTSGVVLESGALDGLRYSVSYIFERMGWSAFLIEGSPQNFQNLTRNRPHTPKLHVAICDKPRTIHYVEKIGVSGILEFMHPAHIQKWHPDFAQLLGQNDSELFEWGRHMSIQFRKDHPDVHEVQCVPTSQALSRLKLNHVDFWILDVENAELQVLSTVDWTTTTVNVLVVECDSNDEQRNQQIKLLLENKGYTWEGKQAHNYWFTRKGFVGQRKPGAKKEKWMSENV